MVNQPVTWDDLLPQSDEHLFCCPLCLTWYTTDAQRQRCLTVTHGYTVLETSVVES